MNKNWLLLLLIPVTVILAQNPLPPEPEPEYSPFQVIPTPEVLRFNAELLRLRTQVTKLEKDLKAVRSVCYAVEPNEGLYQDEAFYHVKR